MNTPYAKKANTPLASKQIHVLYIKYGLTEFPAGRKMKSYFLGKYVFIINRKRFPWVKYLVPGTKNNLVIE